MMKKFLAVVLLLFSSLGFAVQGFDHFTQEPYVILEGLEFEVGEDLVILKVNTQVRFTAYIDTITRYGHDIQMEVTDKHTGRQIFIDIPYNP